MKVKEAREKVKIHIKKKKGSQMYVKNTHPHMYLNWQLPSKTYLDVFTFPYKLLNLHVQTACHVSTSLHLCGGMFVDGLIHKYIYIFIYHNNIISD